MSGFSTKSLGVDTYEHDPISHFLLESGNFLKVGRRSENWTARSCSSWKAVTP